MSKANMQSHSLYLKAASLHERFCEALGFDARSGTAASISETDLPLLVQSVALNVNTRKAARKAAALMIARLSPLPQEDILWDIQGPFDQRGERSVFKLGIIRNSELQAYHSGEGKISQSVSLLSQGQRFTFSDAQGQEMKGKRVLSLIGLCLVTYLSCLWALGQLQERQERRTDVLSAQTLTASKSIAQLKAKQVQVRAHVHDLNALENKTLVRSFMEQMTALSNALDEDDRLSSWSERSVRGEVKGAPAISVIGYANAPDVILSRLQKTLKGNAASLGTVTRDRLTGQDRFTLTLTPNARALQEVNHLSGAGEEGE